MCNPRLTLDPTALMDGYGYRFFYPGWVRGDADCVVAERGGSEELALVPLTAAQRFQLAQQMNILALPGERIADLRARLG